MRVSLPLWLLPSRTTFAKRKISTRWDGSREEEASWRVDEKSISLPSLCKSASCEVRSPFHREDDVEADGDADVEDEVKAEGDDANGIIADVEVEEEEEEADESVKMVREEEVFKNSFPSRLCTTTAEEKVLEGAQDSQAIAEGGVAEREDDRDERRDA